MAVKFAGIGDMYEGILFCTRSQAPFKTKSVARERISCRLHNFWVVCFVLHGENKHRMAQYELVFKHSAVCYYTIHIYFNNGNLHTFRYSFNICSTFKKQSKLKGLNHD
jgi:hypothetical protein